MVRPARFISKIQSMLILKIMGATIAICMGVILVEAHKNCGRDNTYQGTKVKADTVYAGDRIILKFKFS